MHKIIKLLRGKQSGQVLVIALALLGVGSLMIAPMMSLMGTGLNAGRDTEIKMYELYACDAGVQDAMWQINNIEMAYPDVRDLEPQYPGPGPWYYTYTSDEEPQFYDPRDPDEEMPVHVKIMLLYMQDGYGTYQVQSWVGNENWEDASTKLDVVITTTWLDFAFLLDNAITSPGEVNLQPGSDVEGGIVCPPPGPQGSGTYDDWDQDTIIFWPTANEIIEYYLRDVDIDNPYADDELDLLGADASLGPEYIDNDAVFDFQNTNPGQKAGEEPTLTLDGTIYLKGDTMFPTTKDWNLDLNGHTIFVESNTTGGGNALDITDSVNILGHGCIVAIGDIYFSPKTGSNPSDFLFVCSIDGEVIFNPQGDFYGAIAGEEVVNLQPNVDLEWVPWPDADGDGIPDINFPGGEGGGGMIWGIHTWSYWEIGDEIP